MDERASVQRYGAAGATPHAREHPVVSDRWTTRHLSLVRTLSSPRGAADRVRPLVLTPESDSPCARTPRAASAPSGGEPITRSSLSRPSLNQMAWESVCSFARVRERRSEDGRGAAKHREGAWGDTDKPRRVSYTAAARAPARPTWPLHTLP